MGEIPVWKEEWQPGCPLDSLVKEDGIKNEHIKIEENLSVATDSKDGSAWISSLCLRNKNGSNAIYRAVFYLMVGSMILNFILIILLSALVRRDKREEGPLLSPGDLCPSGWIEFQRKCYYFSEDEGNWASSSLYCSSHNASLAVIDSQEEMKFLLRYKSPPDHWIGLRRDNPEQLWRWINGTIFHVWTTVQGRGRCAYMNHKAIASSSCSREEHWICSKPAESYQFVTT
nr:PREDICTED: C-type lectin domain family 2 member B [Anolis carolinensis]|eukprot:XP_008122148.1 PREDICTED: C-type lectin domain family 2 member B [Anolis carolinensis]